MSWTSYCHWDSESLEEDDDPEALEFELDELEDSLPVLVLAEPSPAWLSAPPPPAPPPPALALPAAFDPWGPRFWPASDLKIRKKCWKIEMQFSKSKFSQTFSSLVFFLTTKPRMIPKLLVWMALRSRNRFQFRQGLNREGLVHVVELSEQLCLVCLLVIYWYPDLAVVSRHMS